MRPVSVVPFESEHLRAAGGLLAARHAAHRTRSPHLPERFEDPTVARVAVEAIVATLTGDGAAAVVALGDGDVVGYLAGSVGPDGVGGVQAMVGGAAHAVAPGWGWSAYRGMYADLAGGWRAAGALKHAVVVPAGDDETDAAFFSLSFGQEQAYALRDLSPVETRATDVRVRLAGLDDLDAVVAVGDVIAVHQARSPVFSAWRVSSPEGLRTAHHHELTTPSEEATYFLAFIGDQPVGLSIWYPMRDSPVSPTVPAGCVELAVAQTAESARGRGVGTALLAAGIEWARDQRYQHIETDWRTTNLLSSAFWPARGFAPTSYRLARYLPVAHAAAG